MSDTASLRPDLARANAMDPTRASAVDEMRIYNGVRTRRSLAFLVDYTAILLLAVPVAIVVAILGLVTLGLGWALFAVLLPAVALVYVAFTLGGSAQSTPGMRMFGVRLSRLDGGRIDPAYAILHSVLFWASCSVLTPFVLLMALFTQRKQMLHDYLLGTVAVRRNV